MNISRVRVSSGFHAFGELLLIIVSHKYVLREGGVSGLVSDDLPLIRTELMLHVSLYPNFFVFCVSRPKNRYDLYLGVIEFNNTQPVKCLTVRCRLASGS